MNIEERYIPYLKGDKLSHGLKFDIPASDAIRDRVQLITEFINQKKVIHLGFLDHIEVLDYKIEKGQWLHQKIEESSRECLGIDINKEGVEYLKKKYSFKNVICADILNDQIEQVMDAHWDYMVMGEVLEHVDNPCYFLSQIKRKYLGVIDRLIITVPNAFSAANFSYIKKQYECINSDHRYWFTPYTLCKLITLSQMKISNLFFCTSRLVPKRKIFKRHFHKKYPGLREIIVAVVEVGA